MSLLERPYIGTWTLNQQQLVQHTPDALVYINGDLSVPGCSKCSGKINIQQFLTEVSVDAGTDSGSASATFSLSIPLHHTDSFARDAKFILRPGLEVHIYMRGYFPVKGLYAHLAEGRPKASLEGASAVPARVAPVEDTSGQAVVAGRKLTKQEWVDRFGAEAVEAAMRQWPGDPQMQAHFVAVALGHSYLETGGKPHESDHNLFGQKGTGTAGSYGAQGFEILNGEKVHLKMKWAQFESAADAFDRYANHYKGNTAEAFLKASPAAAIAYQVYVRGYSTGNVPPHVVSNMKSMGFDPQVDPMTQAILQDASQYESVVKDPNTGRIVSRPRKAYVLSQMPDWKKSVASLTNQHDLADQIVASVVSDRDAAMEQENYEGITSAQGGFLPPPDAVAVSSEMDPSLLDELGLAGQGIENTLAYPYYHVFHGVITEVSHSYSGGVSTVSVNCSSMLHFWQYHNMSTNASVFGARPTNSKNKMSLVGHNFTGMHPYAIMYSLHYDMAGAAGGVGWALSSKSNQKAVNQGGESLFSLNVRYWEKRFARGTRLRMHGATGELFSTMAAAWLSRKSSGALSEALKARYNNPKKFARTDIGSQMVALGLYSGPNVRNAIEATRFAAQSKPEESNSAKFEINVLEMQAFVSDIGNWGQVNLFESTYESKLDIANKVCEVTGFEFYQDVDGDFVFKPPMWNLDTSSSRVYCIEDIDIINISFSEKEPQVTYMTVKGSHFKNILGTGAENEWGVRGQYIDYRLVAQFGWRPGSYETSYFNDPKSMFFAAVNRMDVMNIGVQSASLTIPERPELRPGYPVYIRYLDCFYYCNSFSHSHSVGGQCTTTLQLVGKRAKFYAPGSTTKAGIAAIDLGDTKLPERPLGVLDLDGKPRLSGFPNVVMALDPTAINPLFFVVGTDIENISDARVVKYLLETAEKHNIVFREEDEDGKVYYTMSRTIKDGDDSEEVDVRFFFDQNDLNPVQDSGDINIMAAAVQYNALLAQQAQKDETDRGVLDQKQREISARQSEITAITHDPSFYSDSKVAQDLANRKATLEKEVSALTQEWKNLSQSLQDEKIALEASWRENSSQGAGVALLLEVLNKTSEAYRMQAEFQNRADLSSTINLLDMLSDKKATFSNGQQPGQYRYYSASHPDIAHQGPKFVQYEDRKVKEVGDAPLRIAPDRKPPAVAMFQRYPTSPFPGAAIPEAELRPGTPEVGIKVLTANPTKPGGEVLATSEITELMFTVQDVTVAKMVTSSYSRSQVTGMGRAAEGKIQAQFVPGNQPTAADTLATLFKSTWDDLRQKVSAAISKMEAAASSSGQAVTFSDLGLPVFPDSVPVGSGRVATASALGTYKYAGNSSAESLKTLGPQTDKKPLDALVSSCGAALGASFNSQMQKIIEKADKRMMEKSDGKSREQVASAFREGFQVGAPLKTTTKGRVSKNMAKKEKTFSPVFPVSDARGYHVVGSYRYGRGVDIDPEGVFDQFHKHDVFRLLDKHLVEQILQFFVQGEDIQIPEMQTVDAGNGKKKTIPITDPTEKKAAMAKYLNDEALRQLRAANLTDKQILDYSQALSKGAKAGQLDFSLANYFTDVKKDGVQKVPLNNAAYSLADLNFQQAGQVCACKAAEANVLLTAYGQEQFVSLSQAGSPAHEGFGSDPSDAATRWVATQAELAAAQWERHQQALRGQVLDRSGSHIVSSFLDTFGIDAGGVERDSVFEENLDAAEQRRQGVLQAKAKADTQIENL